MSAQPSFVTPVAEAPGRELVVRMSGGDSALTEMTFTIGRPAPLVSVGTRGDWRVLGRGVAPVHAVLAFNGAGLFACVREGAYLFVDGVRVASGGWVAVPAGATLALGEVRLTVVMGESFGTTQIVPPMGRGALGEETSIGGSFGTTQIVSPMERGALGEVTSVGGSFGTTQIVPPMGRGALGEETSIGGSFGTTQIVPPMGLGAPSAPRLPLSDGYAPSPAPVAARAPVAAPAPVAARAPVDSFGVTRMVPPEVWRSPMRVAPVFDSYGSTRLAAPLARRRPRSPASSGHAFGAAPVDAPNGHAFGAAPVNGPNGQAFVAAPVGPNSQAFGVECDELSAVRLAAHAHASASLAAAPAGERPSPASPARRGRDAFARAWRSSSHAKKAMLVLLGPTLLAAVLSLRAPTASPAPPMRPATPSARAPEAPGPTPSGSAQARRQPTPRARAAPEARARARARRARARTVAPAPPGTRRRAGEGRPAEDTERRAIDAVAAGSGDAAAAQYDALAKENPDNPAFAEAARILRARAAEAR
ncbi:MAG: hypothetical protein KF795_07285 [Labilithrix sp.]|nr:hypothetical protein [Labilithrix sp.]